MRYIFNNASYTLFTFLILPNTNPPPPFPQPSPPFPIPHSPFIERADGDTDKDSGEKKIKILRQCSRSRAPDLDPDFFTQPVKKARDPGSQILNTVSDNFVEKSFKKF